MLCDLYNISIDESNDFTFDLESLNGTKRNIIVVLKVSTNDSFKKIVPVKLKEFQTNLVSDWFIQRRTKNEIGTSLDNIRKDEDTLRD